MAVIEAIFRAAESGKWERPEETGKGLTQSAQRR
jgi:hypothetical protein